MRALMSASLRDWMDAVESLREKVTFQSGTTFSKNSDGIASKSDQPWRSSWGVDGGLDFCVWYNCDTS